MRRSVSLKPKTSVRSKKESHPSPEAADMDGAGGREWYGRRKTRDEECGGGREEGGAKEGRGRGREGEGMIWTENG